MQATISSRQPRPRNSFLANEAPVPGPCVVSCLRLDDSESEPFAHVILLGPGRDAIDRDAYVATMREGTKILVDAGIHGRLYVSPTYETVSEAIADEKIQDVEVRMDSTARGLLRAERETASYLEAVAEWNAAVEADPDRDVCDRCGGAGGYVGWPGFTCYDCGGCGTKETRS